MSEENGKVVEETKEFKDEETETIKKLNEENLKLKENLNKVASDFKSYKSNYINDIMNKSTQVEDKKYTRDDIQAMVNDMRKKQVSNREFWQNALKLREAYQDVYHRDIFNANNDPDNVAKAEKVASVMANLVNESENEFDFDKMYEKVVVEDSARINKNAKPMF